jgi:arylsulfatase A-like enzyme/Flp pilus assembly protein TadD
MTGRRVLSERLSTYCLVLALGLGAHTATSADTDPLATLRSGMASGQNLLVVTLDTTRADRLGSYGYAAASTPTLDAFARRALRFAAATSVAAETLPAHCSILTGRYPYAHGVRLNAEYRLGAGETTLAERLRARGYETAAFVSAFVLDARYGLDQGFDLYDDRVEPGGGASFPSGTIERPADRTTDAALAWLERRRAGRPFFAWVHYFDPHAPYKPPAAAAARAPGRPYDGEIAFVDEQLGRVLDRLKAKGLADRTVVAVLGDHGESLGEHGESTHGIFLYDAVLRVPFILSVPGASGIAGAVEDGVVSEVDVVPTLLDLLGVKVGETEGPPMDGRSLVGAPPPADRAVYAESLTPFLDFGWAPLRALRRKDDKAILAPRPEYYDLRKDPGEVEDLGSATGPAAAARDALLQTLRTMEDRDRPAAAPSPAVDPDVRERLAALGYAGGAGPGAPAGGVLRDPKDMIGVSQKLIQANALLSEGRVREALAVISAAAKESPNDRSVLYAQGKIYLRLGRIAEAERALRAFREIRPKADVSLLLAQILILGARYDEAGALLDEAESLEPRHGGIFIARGDMQARQGRADEARRSFEKARAVDPYRAATVAAARLAALDAKSPKP